MGPTGTAALYNESREKGSLIYCGQLNVFDGSVHPSQILGLWVSVNGHRIMVKVVNVRHRRLVTELVLDSTEIKENVIERTLWERLRLVERGRLFSIWTALFAYDSVRLPCS